LEQFLGGLKVFKSGLTMKMGGIPSQQFSGGGSAKSERFAEEEE
jgi:hypothetical protein